MASEELTPEQLSALLSGSLPEIKGYRVLRRIGRGGMSYVYLCVQESLDRLVAIKIISPDALVDEVSKQRFETEARTIAKLEHPGIVSIHEVGRTPQGLLYYVMPYLPKGHLGQTDFTKDEGKVAEILRSLLSALGYLHERGIVHRDVKADNVLFDSADRPLLTDFGIALSRADTARITTAGLALGSGGYMAPEQARGEAVDGRADLYAVGVLAFELLTGRLPFLGTDALSQALMHASDPIPRLPPELRHWQPFIDKAMAKHPDKRFQNTGEMLRALDRAYGHEQYTSRQTQAISAMDFRGKGGGRRKALIATGLALALGAAGYAGWKFVLQPRQNAQQVAAAQPPAVTPAPAPSPADPATPATAPAGTDAPAEPVTDEAGDPAAAAIAEGAATPDANAPLASASGDFSKVQGQLQASPLAYDPAVPGARQVHAAKRQLGQKRLTSPAGDNAIESLAALHRLAPADPAFAPLADEAITAVGKSLAEAVEARRDAVARSGYQLTEKFVRQATLAESGPWKALQASLPPLLLKRLEADARSGDPASGEATKALAGVFKVPQSQLEPAWTQASVVAPKPVAASSGVNAPPFVPISGVGGERITVMREEVTRGEYAQFASATSRADSACRNRNLPFALRKKNWNDPGFPQENSHPVVCVSHADALAYAEWLGQRTGNRYRLPRRAEWQIIAGYEAGADACSNGHIGCGNRGTAPARRGPASPDGINGLQGNVREWLSDCDGGCKRRLAAGLGWRDGAKNADPGRSAGLDAESGYDDIGFRLVRE